MMNTIFITSFHPSIGQNILSGDVVKKLLLREDVRIVIFCPDYKTSYFKNEFDHPHIFIEGIKIEKPTWHDILFGYISRSVISSSTLLIHRKELFYRKKKILPFVFSYFLVILGRMFFLKKVIRWLDQLTSPKSKFENYFKKYNPKLIFATDVFNRDDIDFLACAKRAGVFRVGMVRSWDNITGKGLIRIKPDMLIVPNGIIKEEVIKYQSIPPKYIYVSGLPQMDFYVKNTDRMSREVFFSKIGLNPNKVTIFVAPHGRRFFNDDGFLLEKLKGLPYQYIVRLPPNDTINYLNFIPSSIFFIEHPGISFKEGVYNNRELSLSDSFMLATELFYADVVLNYGSTISIEAAFYDKPIINFFGDAQKNLPYIQSERRFFDFSHLNKLWNLNFCKVSYNFDDLKKQIDEYLKNPLLDKKGRSDFLRLQAGYLDGKSGARIADFLLNHLN
ncbi:MAG: hypothetical protein AAB394_00840 [Patescibacteria group bacterium]